jgi:hypothetical protein
MIIRALRGTEAPGNADLILHEVSALFGGIVPKRRVKIRQEPRVFFLVFAQACQQAAFFTETLDILLAFRSPLIVLVALIQDSDIFLFLFGKLCRRQGVYAGSDVFSFKVFGGQ